MSFDQYNLWYFLIFLMEIDPYYKLAIRDYLGPHKIPVTREDCGSLLSEFPEYVSTLTLGIKQMYIFKTFNRRKLPSKAKTKLGIIDNKLKWEQEFLQVCRLF